MPISEYKYYWWEITFFSWIDLTFDSIIDLLIQSTLMMASKHTQYLEHRQESVVTLLEADSFNQQQNSVNT